MITVVDSSEIQDTQGNAKVISKLKQITLDPKKFLNLPLSELKNLEILFLSTKGCFLDDESFSHIFALISQIDNLTCLSLDLCECKFEEFGFQYTMEGISKCINLVDLTLNLRSN